MYVEPVDPHSLPREGTTAFEYEELLALLSDYVADRRQVATDELAPPRGPAGGWWTSWTTPSTDEPPTTNPEFSSVALGDVVEAHVPRPPETHPMRVGSARGYLDWSALKVRPVAVLKIQRPKYLTLPISSRSPKGMRPRDYRLVAPRTPGLSGTAYFRRYPVWIDESWFVRPRGRLDERDLTLAQARLSDALMSTSQVRGSLFR